MAVLMVDISEQSVALLWRLARLGIYGRNASEVASRFVDLQLADMVNLQFTVEPELLKGITTDATREKK